MAVMLGQGRAGRAGGKVGVREVSRGAGKRHLNFFSVLQNLSELSKLMDFPPQGICVCKML